MNHEFIEALDELEKDRGIDKDILIDTIEQALLTAYKKNFGSSQNVRIDFNREKGDVKVYSQRRVVDESDLYDNFLEIELSEARQINPKYELGDILENEVTPKDFGRNSCKGVLQAFGLCWGKAARRVWEPGSAVSIKTIRNIETDFNSALNGFVSLVEELLNTP